MSLVLIDEPGKGPHWTKQASEVGHIRIEQIKEGFVVVGSNKQNFELRIQSRPETNKLLKETPLSIEGQLAGNS